MFNRISSVRRPWSLATATALLLGMATSSLAHEAWILPYQFNQQNGPVVKAHIQVGQSFNGTSQLYNPDRFERMEIIRNGDVTPVQGRAGDLPAINQKLEEPGLHVLLYQSGGSVISYGNWEKFVTFTDKEGVSWAQQEHIDRGYPREDFDEVFVRYAKALITWQSGEGSDGRTGMPMEIVALNNPYTDDSGQLDIEVLWQGAPYPDSRVSVFRRRGSDDAERTNHQTDARGRVSIPVTPDGRYLLNSVYMEPLDNGTNTPVWRSHWASMTLQLPSP